MGQPSQEKDIFLQAIEITSVTDRSAFLDIACEGDRHLRRKVECLLGFHDDSQPLFECTAIALSAAGSPTSLEGPGTSIGPYRLIEQIGEGGFGLVYSALQTTPVHRHVALKILKPGMDTRDVVARFDVERHALALMNHPHIARVLDAGATGTGRPYFVMELVDGVSITEFCDQHQLSIRERLELFVRVCVAVQHAHQKGVIHRDLKPSNVLVLLQDGLPAPKVIDFGVAKALNQRLTEHTLLATGICMLGTPLYMSPEQAEAGSIDVDTRSDIYSLGVLLYELLTGTTPAAPERLRLASLDEVRRIIIEEEPPRPSRHMMTCSRNATAVAECRRTTPSRLQHLLDRDLDWVVMKALEKDRRRRYETVSAFAGDIERFLAGEGVHARPKSVAYRLQKLALRHRTGLVVALALLLVALVGLAVSTSLIARQRDVAREEARKALVEKNIALENLYLADIKVAQQDWESGQIRRMHSLLDAHRPQPGAPDLRGWEWYYLHSLCHRDRITLRSHSAEVRSVCFSPDGKRFASGSQDGTVRIWDTATGDELGVLRGHRGQISSVAWSPDGRQLASGDDRTDLIIWDTESLTALFNLKARVTVWALAWRPDSRMVAAGGYRARGSFEDGQVTLWDAESGKKQQVLVGGVGVVRSLAWSPDGAVLAAGENWQGRIQIWDPVTATLLHTFKAHDHFIGALAWSPDGQHLASGSESQAIRIFSGRDWTLQIDIPKSHLGTVDSVNWSGDGTRLASAGQDGFVRIWDTATGAQMAAIRGHQGAVPSVAFSKDGKTLISGSRDHTVKVWDVATATEARKLAGRSLVAWSPDGKHLAVERTVGKSAARAVSVLDAATARETLSLPIPGNVGCAAIAWSPDGAKLAGGLGTDDRIIVWELPSGRVLLEEKLGDYVSRTVSWSPDGQRLALGGRQALVCALDADREPQIKTLGDFYDGGISYFSDAAVWNARGTLVAVSTYAAGVKVCDPDTGSVVLDLKAPKSGNVSQSPVAWSPDGSRLAVGCSAGQILVYDAATGRQLLYIEGHTSPVQSVSWNPRGDRLASGAGDRQVKVWDVEKGRELLSLSASNEPVSCVAWSPDGHQLAIATTNGVSILDATAGYALEQAATNER